MLIKTGVDISRLKPPIRKKLNLINQICSEFSKDEMVITSTYEGSHSPGSLHYADLAIDVRSPKDKTGFFNALIRNLGNDYDVVAERDHIHIEYDPK